MISASALGSEPQNEGAATKAFPIETTLAKLPVISALTSDVEQILPPGRHDAHSLPNAALKHACDPTPRADIIGTACQSVIRSHLLRPFSESRARDK